MHETFGVKMATPFFNIIVFKPDVGAGSLIDNAFETIVKTTMLDRLGKVVSKSGNAKVQTGFSVSFVLMSNADSKKKSTDVPASTFRVHLISPKSADVSGAIALKKAVAPSFPDALFRTEIPKGSGLGGRADNGENFAFVQLFPFTSDATLADAKEKELLARGVAEMACHELGHAMGIKKNQGKGLMKGDEPVSTNVDDPPAQQFFEEADAKIMNATLEKIAGA